MKLNKIIKVPFYQLVLAAILVPALLTGCIHYLVRSSNQTLVEVMFSVSRGHEYRNVGQVITAIVSFRHHSPNNEVTNQDIMQYLPFSNGYKNGDSFIENQYSDDGYEVFLGEKSSAFTILSKSIPEHICNWHRNNSNETHKYRKFSVSFEDSHDCKPGSNTITWKGDLNDFLVKG